MSEPTYGSGQQYDPQGYGGQQQYGQQYGGQPPQQPPQQPPYSTGQQPQQPYGGGYGQQPGGYPSGSYPASSPTTPKAPQDKLALAGTVATYIGYACAGLGVLAFILYLASDSYGDGIGRFAASLIALVTGLGFGGLNFAVGSWLTSRSSGTTS